MFGEFANFGHYLAAAAYTSAATDGVEVDAEFTCGVEDVCAAFHLALTPGGGEDDVDGIGHDGRLCPLAATGTAAGATSASTSVGVALGGNPCSTVGIVAVEYVCCHDTVFDLLV